MQMINYYLKLTDIMWSRLDHPDRGIIGASHSIEKYMHVGNEEDSSEEEMEGRPPNKKCECSWLKLRI